MCIPETLYIYPISGLKKSGYPNTRKYIPDTQITRPDLPELKTGRADNSGFSYFWQGYNEPINHIYKLFPTPYHNPMYIFITSIWLMHTRCLNSISHLGKCTFTYFLSHGSTFLRLLRVPYLNWQQTVLNLITMYFTYFLFMHHTFIFWLY